MQRTHPPTQKLSTFNPQLSTDAERRPEKPVTVGLIELAISAGLGGRPVGVCFPESSAAVDCELWKYVAGWVGGDRMRLVRTVYDTLRLSSHVDDCRYVMLYAPSRLHEVACSVQFHPSVNTRRPSIFCWSLPGDIDAVPLPVLILRADPAENRAVMSWLQAGAPNAGRLRDEHLAPGAVDPDEVVLDPAIVPVTVPASVPSGAGKGPRRLRDCQAVRSLLSGAALLHREGKPAKPMQGSPSCGRGEYELVRGLLQSPLLTTDETPVSQLAIDMIDRANVLLKFKNPAEMEILPPLLMTDSDPDCLRQWLQTGRETTSRREVADLGNVESRLLHGLLSLLQKVEPGYKQFLRMGLQLPPPDEETFRSTAPETLARSLTSWSHHQVHRQFEALQKTGMISFERASANQRWQYRLPEELQRTTTPFASLPPADELFESGG